MTVRTQRAEIIKAISDLFLVKGQTEFNLDETIVPVVNIGDIANTPYLRYPRAVGLGTVSAVGGAGTFPYVGARPAPNKVLQLSEIHFENATAGVLRYSVQLMTATDIANLTTQITAGQLADLGGTPLVGARVGSFIASGLFTSGTAIGIEITAFRVPASSTLIWTIPRPGLSLFGNDDGGSPGLYVVGPAVLSAVKVSFFGREWPLPGQ